MGSQTGPEGGLMRLAAVIAVGTVLTCAGCGGSSGSSPSSTPPTPVDFVPTRLTVVSGETGAAIANARVVISGQSQQTDASGGVAVPAGLGRGAFIDIVAPGFLDRQTALRGTEIPSRLTLWPRTSPVGLDENLTAVLAFTRTQAGAPVGGASMLRQATGLTQVHVRLSAALLADPEAVRWHEFAVGSINEANGGTLIYQLSANPPLSATVIDVSYDPASASCPGARGFTNWRLSGSTITSASVVYCVPDGPRSATVVHELGHTFGLQHSPSPPDVMFGTFVSSRAETFTPRERLLMRLMLQRTPGTLFPDNDRDTTGATSIRTETIRCPLGS
jgi:hypothetical protein